MDATGASPVRRERLSDQVYLLLKQRISSGELTQGQRLVESELAREHQLSLAPVREALRRLGHEGLVLQLPRRGSFVASISDEEARRSYDLRSVLEEFAARDFCRSAPGTALERLRELVGGMTEAAREDDLERLIELDISFHRSVWEATAHPLLPRMWPLVEASLRSYATVAHRAVFGSLEEVAQTHQLLFQSLVERDPERAAALFGAHSQLPALSADGAGP